MSVWASNLHYPCYVVFCDVANTAARVALVHSAADLEDRWQEYPGFPRVLVFPPDYFAENPE